MKYILLKFLLDMILHKLRVDPRFVESLREHLCKSYPASYVSLLLDDSSFLYGYEDAPLNLASKPASDNSSDAEQVSDYGN